LCTMPIETALEGAKACHLISISLPLTALPHEFIGTSPLAPPSD
jgi:hypothetical protein